MKIAAIGCSFTNYIWPSYADVLAADNYGLSGIGNDRIWHILCYLHKTNQLKSYDAVVIQWTSPFRFDYKTKNGWTHNDGSIAHSEANKHIWKAIRHWYNESFEIEKSENYVLSAIALCNQNNTKLFSMSMTDDITKNIDLTNLKDKYKDRYTFLSAPWTKKPFQDEHPTIIEHVKIAQQIATKINYSINETVVENCKLFHNKILQGMDFDDTDKYYKLNFPYRYVAACL